MDAGPILGILSISRTSANPFVGGQNESFTEILTVAAKMNCAAYVFSPFDIDWNKKAVWGYLYNSKSQPGEWERQLFPLPSVIYNRIPNRTMENKETIKNAVEMLQQIYGRRLFNPCFLDKWRTHTILCSNKQTSGFLPETHWLQNPTTVVKMLKRYDTVYLKPTANSLGNEMVKIEKRSSNEYLYIHQTLNNQRREGLLSSPTELVAELLASEGAPPYLVQQAIDLAQYQGRPFDLRLLVQKNRHGNWQRTGLAARVAGPESISTHVFYGGSRYPAKEAIRNASLVHGFSISEVNRQLKKIITVCPVVMEKYYGQAFGELEMDLGIDRWGKVWFFEANSKPFRFDEKLIRAKSLVRLIHYTKYLDACEFGGPAL